MQSKEKISTSKFTVAYYANLTSKLNHEKASSHTSTLAKDALGFQLVERPPYSPDLVPIEY